ncbi:MAG: type IV secretion protein IcmC [Legionella sp.]|nr:MAG: type IV secretion protein IcmC [Legionella sp.]
MNSIDFITILGNISQALIPVQNLVTGLSYLLGIVFFISAVMKFKAIGEKGSQEKVYVPLVYLAFGVGLIYLPSAMSTMANTVFGVGNVLTYSDYNTGSVYSAMLVIIRTTGLIWFVRGSVLLAHASRPGVQEGPKGLVFMSAGILSMNIDTTVAMVNTIVNKLIHWTMDITS